jgi:dihydropteroate synthase
MGEAMSDNNAHEASIKQIKSALEEIGKGIDLIDFSGPATNQNIAAVTKIILPELKRALAALARMEQP